MSDLTVERARRGWTRVARRWTESDGSRREEWTNIRDDGAALIMNVSMPPPSRWQRLAATPLGRLIPRPWSEWISCHGRPRWDGCTWNQRLRDRLTELAVCRRRGHDAIPLVEGYRDMCTRCRLDWEVDE